MAKAVFIDRDGTLIKDKVETVRPGDLEFLPGADSLALLKDAGFLLILITNQSGIGKGHYSETDMHKFNEHMLRRAREMGVYIDAVYFCPHTKEENCCCRKPAPGMLLKAAEDLDIDLNNSYMIGDQNSDALAGVNAGVKRNYIVTTGIYPGGEYIPDPVLEDSTEICTNLREAVLDIVENINF